MNDLFDEGVGGRVSSGVEYWQFEHQCLLRYLRGTRSSDARVNKVCNYLPTVRDTN